jgi:hypothetical protein
VAIALGVPPVVVSIAGAEDDVLEKEEDSLAVSWSRRAERQGV